MLKRVDDMTEITRHIMAGDLGGRLKVAGTGDELDRLAQNLNDMLDRIGELMRGMQEVSDNIAHDLKTPLTRLRNKADEALRTASTPDELKSALEATIEESDNLIRIFNALLMIARLEAGNAREGLADFDAAEAVRDVAELYEALAEEAGVSLEISVEDGLPVHGSRELLGQAVANLLDNALKYGATPGISEKTISVSAHRQDGEVQDRGGRSRPRHSGIRAGPCAGALRPPGNGALPTRLRLRIEPRGCRGPAPWRNAAAGGQRAGPARRSLPASDGHGTAAAAAAIGRLRAGMEA